MESLFGLDWQEIYENLIKLGAAYLFSLPIAYDRDKESRGAGLRTFPLVSLAACGYALVGMSVLSSTEAEAKVIQGIITGIGFIGGGAILKNNGSTSGTATAASIWNTGLIGVAVAFERYEIALLLSTINFITLRYVKKFKDSDSDN
ncbi:MgtC/SapB family protein [Pleionea sediminis]|uniref:MgtC/SapB family protein n=1 Tax=Pleionea sediminis TaxID=2569479 RepID=UPI0011872174|nr:MgtC/SapB family protein [Pleionea sediminis]